MIASWSKTIQIVLACSPRVLFLPAKQSARPIYSHDNATWKSSIGSASALPIILKPIGNRKRDCAWGCARGINTTWENVQIAKHKSVRWGKRTPSWFVLCDLQIFSGGFYPQAQPHAQSLFLFPIVFGINLSLSLSLSISLSHRAHQRHNIGSASALPITVFGINLIHFFDGKSIRNTCNTSQHLRESEERGRNFLATEIVRTHSEYQRHNGDHLIKKGEMGRVKRESKSANFRQEKV